MTSSAQPPSASANPADSEKASFHRIVDVFIRVALIFLLALWCFEIIKPFLLPVLWGVILAVALFPVFHKLESALGGRPKLAAMLFALVGIALLVIPAYFFFAGLIENSSSALDELRAGTLEIPPPADSVQQWPLVGKKLHAEWLAASNDLEGTLQQFGPQIRDLVAAVVRTLAGLGMGVAEFVISLLIAAAFLATSKTGAGVFHLIFRRIVGERGDEQPHGHVFPVRLIRSRGQPAGEDERHQADEDRTPAQVPRGHSPACLVSERRRKQTAHWKSYRQARRDVEEEDVTTPAGCSTAIRQYQPRKTRQHRGDGDPNERPPGSRAEPAGLGVPGPPQPGTDAEDPVEGERLPEGGNPPQVDQSGSPGAGLMDGLTPLGLQVGHQRLENPRTRGRSRAWPAARGRSEPRSRREPRSLVAGHGGDSTPS